MSLEKNALLERLVRLGATDIPHTPRLVMRHRSPEELGALQEGVTGAFKRMEDPVKAHVGRLVDKVPSQGVQKVLRAGSNLLIENPETIPMQAVPVPGLTPLYLGVKRGLEKAIDKAVPLKKTAFTESAYSGGTAAKFIKQHSSLPPARLPSLQDPLAKTAKRYKVCGDVLLEVGEDGKSLGKGPVKLAAGAPTRGNFMMASEIPSYRQPPLRTPLEKDGDMLPDYVTYGPGDFKPARLNKKAAFSPAQALRLNRTVGTPKIRAPGPSIAEIAKPRGPGFGTGIAGAFKGHIGGDAGVSLK